MTSDTKTTDKHLIKELKTLALDRTEVSDAGKNQFLEANRLLHGQEFPGDPGAYFLVVVSGMPPTWRRITPPFTIGRHKTCDLALPKGWVSNQHCRVVKDNEDWLIRDLDSTNGTFVNSVRTSERCLRLGDVVDLGSAKLVFYAISNNVNEVKEEQEG